MPAVPPALRDALHLESRAQVGLTFENGRLVVELSARPRYTLDQLLAKGRPKARRTAEDREWSGDGRVGAELL